jgi:hypothetical protein
MAWIRRRSSRGIETFRMSPPPVGIGVGDQAGELAGRRLAESGAIASLEN